MESEEGIFVQDLHFNCSLAGLHAKAIIQRHWVTVKLIDNVNRMGDQKPVECVVVVLGLQHTL